jgi:hypothetical protein
MDRTIRPSPKPAAMFQPATNLRITWSCDRTPSKTVLKPAHRHSLLYNEATTDKQVAVSLLKFA